MRRALPTLAILLALAVAVALSASDAWRSAEAGGWIEAGYGGLVRDAFWHRFDRTAPIALGAALLLGAVAAPRRLRAAVAVVAVVAVVRGIGWAWDRIGPARPNVLLVSIDTLRADRLGTYGYSRPTSPTLDHRLTDGGVVFENAWAQSPKTTPSHMTMLTSLYPSVHGVDLWMGAGAAPTLNPRVHTLAEVLKNAGYATAAFTAGGHMHRDRGFGHGFDVYKHGDQLPRALEWLRGHHGRPFFLFFHTYEVHDPYTPPPALTARFAADPVPAIAEAVASIRAGAAGWSQAHKRFWAPVDGDDPRHVRYVSDLYDAGIRQMDDTTLTTLLNTLEALGLADHTLVVFTSDHGEAFHEHGRFLHGDLYVETLHVPLVLRVPGTLPAGQRVGAPVGLVDLMPTILDLLGLPVPAQAQGSSVARLARGEDDAPAPPLVFAEFSDAASGRVFESVRDARWTFVRDRGDVGVFDRATDAGEHRDLASADPARSASMQAVLERWHATNVAAAARWHPRPGDAAAPSPRTLEQLRALGYVE